MPDEHEFHFCSYTVPGFSTTPASRPGAVFDNVRIAMASEKARDIFELAEMTGYEPDGRFLRRLSHMARHEQIDPKFEPRLAGVTPR
jgi:hypothetical protein